MYDFNLTEEIARWAFEVVCSSQHNWYISFTNPTAGPWKTIKGKNANGEDGEVYRFELEENRPDIVLVNDELQVNLIIEAKDSLNKLVAGNQVEKSVRVVHDLSIILQRERGNEFWRQHARNTVIMGLLWGTQNPTTVDERNTVFDTYHNEALQFQSFNRNIILGIETRRVGNGLTCSICGKYYEQQTPLRLDGIAHSFNLPLLE